MTEVPDKSDSQIEKYMEGTNAHLTFLHSSNYLEPGETTQIRYHQGRYLPGIYIYASALSLFYPLQADGVVSKSLRQNMCWTLD